jgi:hypothetical protein
VAVLKSAIAAAQHVGHQFFRLRPGTLLLSAMAAAVMVVAQVMDTMAEDHMLRCVDGVVGGWPSTVLAVFAARHAPCPSAASSVASTNGPAQWPTPKPTSLYIARTDARVMSELQSAMVLTTAELD